MNLQSFSYWEASPRGEFILVMTINLSIAGLHLEKGEGGFGYRAFTAQVGGGARFRKGGQCPPPTK